MCFMKNSFQSFAKVVLVFLAFFSQGVSAQTPPKSMVFNWDIELKFISEVIQYASNSKISCLLKLFEEKNYISVDNNGLTYAPIQHKELNVVVQFNQNDISFILTDHDLNMTWNRFESILDGIISFSGIPSSQFDKIVREFKAMDPTNDNFKVIDSGKDFIDVYTVDDNNTSHYKRSELFMIERPQYHRNDDGEVGLISLELLYFLDENDSFSSLELNIFRNTTNGGYYIEITAPLNQKKNTQEPLCDFAYKTKNDNERPYLNANPLSFSEGYNLNPYNLESFISVFYYDMFSNLPGYFGKDFNEIAFKVMQVHKTSISFENIQPNDILEPSNVLAIAQGMYNDCIVEIHVNQSPWLRADNVRRLWIIYHELCHDIFNLEHECGLNIMSPTIPNYIDETMFIAARDELIEYIYQNNLFIAPCTQEFMKLEQLFQASRNRQ